MDHLDISNTADSTGAFTLVGKQLLRCYLVQYFFKFNLVYEKATEETGYKNVRPFCSCFGGVKLYVYLLSQEVTAVFFYIRGKSVFPAVYFTIPVSLVSTFRGTLQLRKQTMADLLREWTGGPFMQPCILLQIASTAKTFYLLFT